MYIVHFAHVAQNMRIQLCNFGKEKYSLKSSKFLVFPVGINRLLIPGNLVHVLL